MAAEDTYDSLAVEHRLTWLAAACELPKTSPGRTKVAHELLAREVGLCSLVPLNALACMADLLARPDVRHD